MYYILYHKPFQAIRLFLPLCFPEMEIIFESLPSNEIFSYNIGIEWVGRLPRTYLECPTCLAACVSTCQRKKIGPHSKQVRGGKSEQDRARRRLTAARGNPRESATENTQPMAPHLLEEQRVLALDDFNLPGQISSGSSGRCEEQAMVKRCGKSAPRCRQRQRHGKPRRLQNQVCRSPARAIPAGRLLV